MGQYGPKCVQICESYFLTWWNFILICKKVKLRKPNGPPFMAHLKNYQGLKISALFLCVCVRVGAYLVFFPVTQITGENVWAENNSQILLSKTKNNLLRSPENDFFKPPTKVPYFFYFLEKFTFVTISSKIGWVSKNVIFFFRCRKKKYKVWNDWVSEVYTIFRKKNTKKKNTDLG